MSESRYKCAAINLREIGGEEEFHPFDSVGEVERNHAEHQQEHKQHRHEDIRHLLDALAHPLEENHQVDSNHHIGPDERIDASGDEFGHLLRVGLRIGGGSGALKESAGE